MIMTEDPEMDLPQSPYVISSQIVPPDFSDEEQLRAEGKEVEEQSGKSLLAKYDKGKERKQKRKQESEIYRERFTLRLLTAH